MRDLLQLFYDRLIDHRMRMSVDIAPHARDTVEVTLAVDVDELTSLSRVDDKWLVFGHLRETVPHMTPVPATQVVICWSHSIRRLIDGWHQPGNLVSPE